MEILSQRMQHGKSRWPWGELQGTQTGKGQVDNDELRRETEKGRPGGGGKEGSQEKSTF
jgi:hypothetical protein